MKKIKLIKILAGFFALMLLFTFLSRAADSVNVAQVETKTAQNQVITQSLLPPLPGLLPSVSPIWW